MRVDEILPRLFISARTHQLSDAEKLILIQKHQLTVVVNLWHTSDVIVRNAVHTYIHCSIPDGKSIAPGMLELGQRIAEIYSNEEERILVHCYGGRNRAALLVGLVVCCVLDVSGEDLVKFIQARRKGALKNSVFANWLRDISLEGTHNDPQFTRNFGIR